MPGTSLSSLHYFTYCSQKWVIIWWLRQYRIHLQFRRPKFDPWFGKIPWRWAWQRTPVFLPGKLSEESGGLCPWGRKELDTTEWLTHKHPHFKSCNYPMSQLYFCLLYLSKTKAQRGEVTFLRSYSKPTVEPGFKPKYPRLQDPHSCSQC